MAEALRLFFLAFYAIGVVVLVLRVLPLAFRGAPAEHRAEGTEPLPALRPSPGRFPGHPPPPGAHDRPRRVAGLRSDGGRHRHGGRGAAASRDSGDRGYPLLDRAHAPRAARPLAHLPRARRGTRGGLTARLCPDCAHTQPISAHPTPRRLLAGRVLRRRPTVPRVCRQRQAGAGA